MVSLRCKLLVTEELKKMGIHKVSVELGVIEFFEDISPEQLKYLDLRLKRSGLELLDDRKSILVEKIKNIIIELVHYSENQIRMNLSDYLAAKLNYDYTYLANLFSEVRGSTIGQFYILHRIERAKELMIYEEYSLSEIAFMLHFSSTSHLCHQFKKITGLTPSHFKKLKKSRRINLENV